MHSRASRVICRCLLASLALIAASYHLTDLAHREAERARQRYQKTQKPVSGLPQDKSKGSPKPNPVMVWLMPDMLDRGTVRAVGTIQVVSCTIDGALASHASAWTVRPAKANFIGLVESLDHARPSVWTHLSDRSVHGPPFVG